jgi:hypothetical protein
MSSNVTVTVLWKYNEFKCNYGLLVISCQMMRCLIGAHLGCESYVHRCVFMGCSITVSLGHPQFLHAIIRLMELIAAKES